MREGDWDEPQRALKRALRRLKGIMRRMDPDPPPGERRSSAGNVAEDLPQPVPLDYRAPPPGMHVEADVRWVVHFAALAVEANVVGQILGRVGGRSLNALGLVVYFSGFVFAVPAGLFALLALFSPRNRRYGVIAMIWLGVFAALAGVISFWPLADLDFH